MARDWQKSYQSIPDVVRADIASAVSDDVVLYAVRRIAAADVSAGDFSHLGISAGADDVFVVPEVALPAPEIGPWARRNREGGYERVRRDLPMTQQTWSFETPNYGDWSKGTHTVTWTRDVFQRDRVPAHGWGIRMTQQAVDDESVTVAFELDYVFNRTTVDDLELFFALNVLQESVGAVSARASGTPIAQYIETLSVEWEILPPGDAGEVLRVVEDRLQPTPQERAVLAERLQLLLSLRPTNLITGKSGFARYVGGMFGDDLVVFENVRYGNAAYVMADNWERLSQLSRLDLLASDEEFERVVHRVGWQRKLRSIVSTYRRRQRVRPPVDDR